MSVEGVTFAVAQKLTALPELRMIYASTPAGVEPVERVADYNGDIADTPAAFVSHERFELVAASWERIHHFIAVDLYFGAVNVAEAEREQLALVTKIIALFRSDIDLGGACTFSVIIGGGPPAPEEVNGKPMTVYPMIVRAQEATAQTYSL